MRRRGVRVARAAARIRPMRTGARRAALSASASLLALAASLLPLGLAAQQPATASAQAVEALADPARPAPAAVPYVHPLYRKVDQPAKMAGRPEATDFETKALLALSLRIEEDGRVSDGAAVEPPVRGLSAPLAGLLPRWKFDPAKKDGRAVRTWATYGLDLELQLDSAAFTAFNLLPVGPEEPLAAVPVESPGDQWMLRYPREIEPKDGSVVSIEDVDFLPAPKKVSWDWDSTRLRSRVTALVLVGPGGKVEKIVATGASFEPALLAWIRQMARTWKVSPALSSGQAVESWMTLDATLEYDLGKAKERAKRMFKKNLRGTPK